MPEETNIPTNNPTAEDIEAQKEGLTGHDLLVKIQDCRMETMSLLKKVPSKLEDDTFDNILSQVMNDQQICLKYIDLLSKNISNVDKHEFKVLNDALTTSKIRISGEYRMVKILRDENPYGKNLIDEEIMAKKEEELYNLNTFLSMSRGHEEIEWESYKYTLQQIENKPPEKKEGSNGLNFFSFLVLGIFVYVLLAKTSLGSKLLKKTKEFLDNEPPEKK